jgi:hypothetical protein
MAGGSNARRKIDRTRTAARAELIDSIKFF